MAIDYFNPTHPLHGIKVRAALRTRRRIFERVMKLAHPGPETRVLDVGTTPDLEIPYNNFFERWYPYPARLSACSIEDCSNLTRRFPGLSFRFTDGETLPFSNREFDFAVSFAVLEHVGSEVRQRRFLGELARVARAFFVYTPYRYFPVEMHTMIPLTHWLPSSWYRALWSRLGLEFWKDESNLNLLSLRAIKSTLPAAGQSRIRLIWSLGWPSIIEVHWRDDEQLSDHDCL